MHDFKFIILSTFCAIYLIALVTVYAATVAPYKCSDLLKSLYSDTAIEKFALTKIAFKVIFNFMGPFDKSRMTSYLFIMISYTKYMEQTSKK